MIALLLLTITVLLGITGTFRVASPRWPRVVTAGLHRNIALLAVGFVAIHVATTLLDTFVHIGLASVVVPFSSGYRTLWLGLGTVASDLLIAVVLTSLLRDRMPLRAWQVVHVLGYACWPLALWHGLGTGTDGRLPWLLLLDAMCLTSVASAIWWRLSRAERRWRRAGRAAMATVVVATLLFAVTGPLQAGWARRAGTPPQLLSGSR
jgi:sulfoxide reductase heme-binding subunit YedZ